MRIALRAQCAAVVLFQTVDYMKTSFVRLASQLSGVAAAFTSVAAFSHAGPATAPGDPPAKSLGVVTVNSGGPTSSPRQIPTTIEGVRREQIEQTINATDSEDAPKYFPSLLVRKRYIGDYNHAMLSSRASGTGNSARSMFYADGILLVNYPGNGANFTPRWGRVTPGEIKPVDVPYGPFSAAYAGNSVGAVVDYVTRMPTKFEAHTKLSGFTQKFKLYGTDSTFGGNQASASPGNKNGDWSWFVNVNRAQSSGQPLTFATRAVSTTAAAAGALAVTGAVAGLDRTNRPWLVLGRATQNQTTQDHAKVKLANDFGVGNESLQHVMRGLSVKSNTLGIFDWEFAAILYSYQKDQLRASALAQPASLAGGAGALTDQTAALGVDDLNNYRYWNLHPYPQCILVAELKFDL